MLTRCPVAAVSHSQDPVKRSRRQDPRTPQPLNVLNVLNFRAFWSARHFGCMRACPFRVTASGLSGDASLPQCAAPKRTPESLQISLLSGHGAFESFKQLPRRFLGARWVRGPACYQRRRSSAATVCPAARGIHGRGTPKPCSGIPWPLFLAVSRDTVRVLVVGGKLTFLVSLQHLQSNATANNRQVVLWNMGVRQPFCSIPHPLPTLFHHPPLVTSKRCQLVPDCDVSTVSTRNHRPSSSCIHLDRVVRQRIVQGPYQRPRYISSSCACGQLLSTGWLPPTLVVGQTLRPKPAAVHSAWVRTRLRWIACAAETAV